MGCPVSHIFCHQVSVWYQLYYLAAYNPNVLFRLLAFPAFISTQFPVPIRHPSANPRVAQLVLLPPIVPQQNKSRET